jgi:hypothetical protein
VEEDAARALLGIGRSAGPAEARVAYRRLIRDAHPDRNATDGARAAALNEAYAVLVRRRRTRSSTSVPAEPTAPADNTSPADPGVPAEPAAPAEPVPAEVLDGDTIHIAAPADEAFALLVEACHRIGHVSYLDRSCAILEAMVRVPDQGTCSLLITLQGRADGTDAFCTLEAVERVAQPPVGPVTAALLEALVDPLGGAPAR